MGFPKDKYVKDPPIIKNMWYHGTKIWPKEDGIRQPIKANSYPKGNGLSSIKPKVTFTDNYHMVEPNSEIEEEELFKVPF